ncbi:MAG: hypothetical protein JXA21_26815, partial [Anaerolineae bacterium]|nr:hypothetical protein [Anaerolineae bacterium]
MSKKPYKPRDKGNVFFKRESRLEKTRPLLTGIHQRLNENRGLAGQEIKVGFLRAGYRPQKPLFTPASAG